MLRICICLAVAAAAVAATLSGVITDPQGRSVPGAQIDILRRGDSVSQHATTDPQGRFAFADLAPGEYRVTAKSPDFSTLTRSITLSSRANTVDFQFSAVAAEIESVTVSADISSAALSAPDPAQRILIHSEILDANPGRPGMPVSIPGMPVESPAGGVKPPQYFVPGVAGDHGEPIAMFFQVGGFLFPNNLPANAHGNGYADPNAIMPLAIESVHTDGGAFNVREGNNSENAAITFGLRDRVEPALRLSADQRDVNLSAGWSPSNPADKLWLGLELSYGNGFLQRLEHRKQYKGNVSKALILGRHDLSIYGIGYYGFAFQPGLIPIDTAVPNDTIDARQREETSNGALILSDTWRLTDRRQFQFSSYYRYYTLDVRPNFGDGLIRQSERRNANAEDVLYTANYSKGFSLLAGADVRREAPRDLDLDRADSAGRFEPLTANNITMNFYSSYIAADGAWKRFFHYNIGYRADAVTVDNQDLYRPAYSFSRRAFVNSPKGSVTLTPPAAVSFLPTASLSYGQAFHVNDPRIGTTAIFGSALVSKARSYQLVLTKTVAQTEFKATFTHATTAQQLARISNDTGLQEDVGPALIRSATFSARRRFSRGFVQAIFSKADARDRLTGEPTPEAPRLIWDVLGTLERLPFHLALRGEYENVGKKPLGDGFDAVPVREFRGALVRSFDRQGIDIGLNLFLAHGYGGQTLETLALAGEGLPFERITGFPLRSYATLSFNYHFGK